MTGYGKAVKDYQDKTLTVELRGLNSKSLDLSCRMPALLVEKELEIRQLIAARLERGKVDLNISILQRSDLSGPAGPTAEGGLSGAAGPTAQRSIIKVVNKSDLMSDAQKAAVDKKAVLISAKNGDLSALRERLVAEAQALLGRATEGVCISGERHYEALMRALTGIRAVQQGLAQNISGEFLSMDLQDVLTALGEVTGQVTNEEVLSNIFSKFCIGK